MRTTFDLPSDVTATLRRESARRGGRARAPMNVLIAEAVRKTYGPKTDAAAKSKLGGRPGRALVIPPKGVKITQADIDAAMEELA